jgi:hypothetical protein
MNPTPSTSPVVTEPKAIQVAPEPEPGVTERLNAGIVVDKHGYADSVSQALTQGQQTQAGRRQLFAARGAVWGLRRTRSASGLGMPHGHPQLSV